MKNSKIRNFFASGIRFQTSSVIVRLAACGLRRAANGCFLLLFTFWIFNLTGCAVIKETTRCVAGISTEVLEDGRKEAITKTLNYDYNTCFSKSEEILRRIGAYIYAKDKKKQMIAVYLSESDTTPVGLFFKNIDAANTQVEVSSPSTYAKELIAGKLFSDLESSQTLEKMEAEINAKREMGDK